MRFVLLMAVLSSVSVAPGLIVTAPPPTVALITLPSTMLPDAARPPVALIAAVLIAINCCGNPANVPMKLTRKYWLLAPLVPTTVTVTLAAPLILLTLASAVAMADAVVAGVVL